MYGAMRTVFLSSTSKDLESYREAAYRTIEGLDGYHCVRMEDFGSRDDHPDDFCRAKVKECDVVVCLLGPCYGSLAPSDLSYTEREFDAAEGKDLLVFLTEEEFPIPNNLVESDAPRERQNAFRKKAAHGRMVTKFSEPDELAARVIQALRNWEIRLPQERPPTAQEPRSTLRLRRLDGPKIGEPAQYHDEFVSIGRSPENTIVIEDPEVSWEHGQIIRMKGQYYYRHLSQTNGTFILRRGHQLKLRPGNRDEVVLHNQDQISLGGLTFSIDFDLIGGAPPYIGTKKRPGT
jgi:hypothetical protein